MRIETSYFTAEVTAGSVYELKPKKATCFNRGMNLVDNFIDIFGSLKINVIYLCSLYKIC